MPFDLEFSHNWNCSAYDRERSAEDAAECVSTPCYNGVCQTTWVETDFGGTVPFGSCACDAGWIGRFCDVCCDMPCQEGTCRIYNKYKLPHCNCYDSSSSGVFCNAMEEEGESSQPLKRDVDPETTAAGLIPAILLPVLFLVVAAILVAMIVMYRRRRARKTTNAIKQSNHMYDVFLSYHTNGVDESDFVTSRLVPFLTREGYTVCIVGSTNTPGTPGTASVATVGEAIAKSRRTVLVLSPDYIKHNWPTVESQSALKDCMEHNHVVIPLIYKSLDRVEAELSINLKFILKSTDQIQWCNDREDESWVKLKSAIPRLIQTNDRQFV